MNDCIFCRILAGEIPSKKLYEDEQCLAFYDIQPLAPQHFLVIPKAHIASAAELGEEQAALVGHIFAVIAKLTKELGFADGFRVVTNCGEDAGQTVKHLHFHVLGGKTLDYVVVPGSGEEADYANLNVKGKVALVSRGVTTFAEKHEMAHAKGAAACIVYNTEAGMINMSIDSFPIPAIFIS